MTHLVDRGVGVRRVVRDAQADLEGLLTESAHVILSHPGAERILRNIIASRLVYRPTYTSIT